MSGGRDIASRIGSSAADLRSTGREPAAVGKRTLIPLTPPAGASMPTRTGEPVANTKANASGSQLGDIDATVTAESGKLSHAFSAKREALQSALGSQTAAIMSTATATHISTVAALADREQVVRTLFAGARANARAAQTTQVALTRADVATALRQLRAESGGIVGQVDEGAKAEAMRMQIATDSSALNVAASGDALRAAIATYPIGDLPAQVPDIEPEESRAVETAVHEAKVGAASAVLDSKRGADKKLRATAAENAVVFSGTAASIAEQVNAKLPEAEHGIRSGGEAVVTVIGHMAATQLAGIDLAERQVLAKIAETKAQAASIVHVGHIAAEGLRGNVGAQVAILSTQEEAAQHQLRAAGAGDQLAHLRSAPSSHVRAFTGQARASLQQGVHQLISTLDGTTAPMLDQLGGAGASFGATIRERRDHLLAGIDSAIGTTGGVLAQCLDELTDQCTKVRADASATYATAEAQLVANAQPGILSARATWKTKADEFIASAHVYESEALTRHAQVRAELPSKMTKVVRDAVAYLRRSTARRIWDGIKSGLGAIAWGLVKFVIAVTAVAAIIMAFVGTTFFALATTVAVVVVGAVMLAVVILTSFVSRLRMLWNNDWPWYAKIIGIPVAFGVAVGDALGIGQITEAIRSRELISDRTMTTEERSARMTEGAFQVITFGLIRKFTRRSSRNVRGAEPAQNGRSRALPPKGMSTSETPAISETLAVNETRPINETPAVNETPPISETPAVNEAPPVNSTPAVNAVPAINAMPRDLQARAGYDPSSRTILELQADRRPRANVGETAEQTRARVRAAEDEILRRGPAIFDALGETPREVNPRTEDLAHHADGAHTTGPDGKHGADIPLRRADNPGGRTIEGRLFGDPPWREQHHSSSKWFSDSTMVRTINEYIRAHWEQIRYDLAVGGEHSGFGNAGSAIGEGFRNTGTLAAPAPLYLVSSLFRIRIRLLEGPPIDFFVVTSFPSPTGLQ
jgi:hypothetical protein